MRGIPLVLLLFVSPAFAEKETPPGCDEVGTYGALDFWVGEWNVYVGDERVGSNRIEKILGGCAVLEHWRGAGGGEGKSLFFVAGDGSWKQVWVTEWATRPGGVKEKTFQAMDSPGEVRFQGRIVRPDGSSYLDRTTLTRLPSGNVRQVIETSTDEGKSWTAGFDAVYRPRS
jgi:hypothetical protein